MPPNGDDWFEQFQRRQWWSLAAFIAFMSVVALSAAALAVSGVVYIWRVMP